MATGISDQCIKLFQALLKEQYLDVAHPYFQVYL